MLYEKLSINITAWENCDVESEMALYHALVGQRRFMNLQKVARTLQGPAQLRRQALPLICSMRKSDINLDTRLAFMKAVKQNNPRCIYENDDIIVAHNITDFPNGTTDAVMMVHLKKDGLIWRTETGSTPIPK